MRKFRVINSEGTSCDLMERKSFFHSIGGLGFADSTQFEKIGTDFCPLENNGQYHRFYFVRGNERLH